MGPLSLGLKTKPSTRHNFFEAATRAFASRVQCANTLRAALQSLDEAKTDYELTVANVGPKQRFRCRLYERSFDSCSTSGSASQIPCEFSIGTKAKRPAPSLILRGENTGQWCWKSVMTSTSPMHAGGQTEPFCAVITRKYLERVVQLRETFGFA
jgi:hypothetical protein